MACEGAPVIIVDELRAPRKRGMEVEMSSKNEMEHFRKLGSIDADEIQECDLDDLARRLIG